MWTGFLFFGASRTTAGCSTDDIIACITVCLGTLVVGYTSFHGLEMGIFLGRISCDLFRFGNVGIRIGFLVPSNFFFVIGSI